MRPTIDERGATDAAGPGPLAWASSARLDLREATPPDADLREATPPDADLREATPPDADLPKVVTRPAIQSSGEPHRAICCVGCGHVITHERSRIEVAGRHEHLCVNPAGYRYRIACFRAAPGTAGVGEWSSFYAWFADHLWQVACCVRCSMHLGWGFEPAHDASPERRFHGLIRNRLREQSTSAPSG